MKSIAMRYLAIALLAFTLSFSSSSAHAERVSDPAALKRAYAALEEQLGYNKSELTFNQQGYENDQLVFSFFLNTAPDSTDGLVMVWLDKEGRPQKIKDIEPIPVDSQVMRAVKACRTADDFAALKEKWESIVAAMPVRPEGDLDISMEQSRRMISAQYAALLRLDIARPQGEGLLPQEAEKKAYQALAALPGMTEEKAELFRTSMVVYLAGPKTATPVYRLLFTRHKTSESAYASDAAFSAYQKKLFHAFSGENAGTPLLFCVNLDAKTGVLTEPIRVQYPSADFPGDLAFFLGK